jgi:hypothetical protein
MDNISNLSSGLPRPEDPLLDINQELSNQFKAAANSVASLYKSSTQRTQLVYKKGYLQCLDDVLDNLHRSPQELEQWLILKKLKLEKSIDNTNRAFNNDNDDDNNDSITTEPEPIRIPNDHEFNISDNQHSITAKFPPTNPILSVDRKSRKQQQQQQQQQSYSHHSTPIKHCNITSTLTDCTPADQAREDAEEEEEEEEDQVILDNSKRKVTGGANKGPSVEKRAKFDDIKGMY